ncbi:hypothetical protein [Hyphomicrobium sp.]|uniref:hypothetical protein n=1 Tax=Hyphomicrobium sp. TaxID=82 RepID=UPI002D78FF47|nr:hypothetical protein [Hyphomicrobium sp.]HET6389822.1 hypothetical protein [Hyphomicrobium sp.]
MRKFIGLAAALASALPLATFATTADAGPGRHARGGHGHHYAHGGYGRHHGRHHGRGYWRNGRWIALGVGAAIAGAAAASAYDDCYWRHGRRYCY